MSRMAREPAGYIRPCLALSFDQPPAPEESASGLSWKGKRAKDRCAPLTPLGAHLLRLHLITHTMDTRAR